MNPSQATLVDRNKQQRRQHFKNRQSSDFYIILQEQLYPLHWEFLTESGYLGARLGQPRAAICIVEGKFDRELFQKVIGFLYGFELTYRRDWQAISLLEIVRFLQIGSLQGLMLEDLHHNEDDYVVFVSFTIGHKLNLQWLRDACVQQFLSMEFQQINFNKFDLFQCDQHIVESIVGLWARFRGQGRVKSMDQKKLIKILHEYNEYHGHNKFINPSIASWEGVIHEMDEQCDKSSINTEQYTNSILQQPKYLINEGEKVERSLSSPEGGANWAGNSGISGSCDLLDVKAHQQQGELQIQFRKRALSQHQHLSSYSLQQQDVSDQQPLYEKYLKLSYDLSKNKPALETHSNHGCIPSCTTNKSTLSNPTSAHDDSLKECHLPIRPPSILGHSYTIDCNQANLQIQQRLV